MTPRDWGWSPLVETPFYTFYAHDGWYTCAPSSGLGGAGVLIMDSRDRVLLLGIHRRRVETLVWEIPRGGADPGEAPLETAVREGAEESRLDLSGATIHDLGPFMPDTGILSMINHLALARLSEPFPEIEPDPREVDTHRVVSWPRFIAMCRNGEIQDPSTIIAALRAQPIVEGAASVDARD